MDFCQYEEEALNTQYSEHYLIFRKFYSIQKKLVRSRELETLLSRVCYSNRLDLLKFLIYMFSYLPDANVLSQACICGHLDIVVYLIEEWKCDPNVIVGDSGYTPFYEAVANGHVEVVRYILGVSNDYLNDHCVLQSALHEACYWGHLNMIKYCVEECKCDLTKMTQHWNHAIIHWAAYGGYIDVLKYLINACSCDVTERTDNGEEPLHIACSNGHLVIIKCLIEEYNCNPFCKRNDGVTPLHCAAYGGHIDVLKYLIGSCNCDVNDRTRDGEEILHIACLKGHLLIVKCLIEEYNCNFMSKRNDGVTPLHCAVYGGHINVFKYLVDTCNCSVSEKMDNGEEALHTACFEGHLVIVKCLIEELKCDPMSKRNDGVTPLHCAAYDGHIDVLKYLITECNCDVTRKTSIGEDVLHIACLKGHLGIVMYLIEGHNCDVMSRDDNGFTPLHCAVRGGHINVLKYLVDTCNCSVTEKIKKNKEPLHIACQYGHFSIVKCLVEDYCCIEKSSVNFSDNIQSVLLVACQNGQLDIIQYFFSTPSNFLKHHIANLPKDFSSKLLAIAVMSNGFHDIVQYLLYDCPLKIKTLDYNLLSSPCHRGDVRMLTLLLSASNTFFHPRLNDKSQIRKSSLGSQFSIGKSIPPIDSYVNIFVLGDPGAGKTTLVTVLKKRSTASSINRALSLTRSVSHEDVELNTVGMIPYRLEHKELGSILLHDLAGQPEYYLSHSAILESCLESTVAVLVVDLRDKNLHNIMEKWLLMIANTKFSNKCQFIVVGSHFDLCKKVDVHKNEEKSARETISSLLEKHNIKTSVKYIALDCRSINSVSMNNLVSLLSESCDNVREYSKSTSNNQYTRMLYAYLVECGVSVSKLSSIIDIVRNTNECYLPSTESDIILSLCYLHATGLIMFLMDDENMLHNSWIVVDKRILLDEVNGVLFGVKQKDATIISHTGIITESGLSSLFPKYESQVIIKFLVSMKLCIIVDEALLVYTNLTIAKPLLQVSQNENVLFFPSLMNANTVDRPNSDSFKKPFSFGWCLQCTADSYFPNRFLHVLLLSICYKYALPMSTDTPFQRLCTVWINGVLWTNNNGIETLLEFCDNGRILLLLMSCYDEGLEDRMVTHRKDVIQYILELQSEVCPSIAHSEYLIDCTELSYPINDVNRLNRFNIEQVASCVCDNGKYVFSCNKKRQPVPLSKLLPGESISITNEDLSIFAGRKPQHTSEGILHFVCASQSSLKCHSIVLNIFQRHFSNLCKSLDHPEILADALWSANLVEFPLLDDIRSLKLSRYETSKLVLDSIFHSLQSFKESKQTEFFKKFCHVLESHGTPTDDIAKEMMTEYLKIN